MPDSSYGSAGDIFRSQILRQGLEDTPYPQQAVSGMLGGATPEQLKAFYQSPQVQSQFKNFGIDPQQFLNIRQSPFLPNSFMGQHPLLGGALTHGLANVAATPEAPLVSGAGSGLSRAAQGMYGGPEMLRQYQLHQLMAPMGAMAAMMPTYGEARRKAIEEAIVNETQQRMQMLPWQRQMQDEKAEIDRIKAEAYSQNQEAQSRLRDAQAQMPKVIPGMGLIYPGQGLQTTHPEGMPPGLGGQVTGGGPQFQPFSPEVIDQYIQTQQALHPERQSAADWRQALVDAGLPEAEASYYSQRAAQAAAAAKGGGGKNADYWGQRYRGIEDRYTKQINDLQNAINSPNASEQQKDEWGAQIDNLNRLREQEKQQIDQERGQTYGGTGGSQPYTPPPYNWRDKGKTPAQVSPGAQTNQPTTGTTQSGAANAGRGSATTATAPTPGLPAGYHFNEQGIPVPDTNQPR